MTPNKINENIFDVIRGYCDKTFRGTMTTCNECPYSLYSAYKRYYGQSQYRNKIKEDGVKPGCIFGNRPESWEREV